MGHVLRPTSFQRSSAANSHRILHSVEWDHESAHRPAPAIALAWPRDWGLAASADTDMRATLLLADAVQASEGKLYLLGGGWSFTGPVVGPMGVAALVEVSWHEANMPHEFRLELQTPDGHPAPVGDDNEPLTITGNLEVGRPAGHPQGVPFNVPLAFNFGPLPLQPGQRFVWAFFLDAAATPDATVGFNTRPQG